MPIPNLLYFIRNVEAKSPTAVLDSTLVHVEEKENAGRLSLLPPCPLPSAVYKAAAAMDEEVKIISFLFHAYFNPQIRFASSQIAVIAWKSNFAGGRS